MQTPISTSSSPVPVRLSSPGGSPGDRPQQLNTPHHGSSGSLRSLALLNTPQVGGEQWRQSAQAKIRTRGDMGQRLLADQRKTAAATCGGRGTLPVIPKTGRLSATLCYHCVVQQFLESCRLPHIWPTPSCSIKTAQHGYSEKGPSVTRRHSVVGSRAAASGGVVRHHRVSAPSAQQPSAQPAYLAPRCVAAPSA